MKIKRPLVRMIIGAVAILNYLGLATIAFTKYPAGFTPRENWLSDLGNNIMNPDGAIYYRLAGIISAIGLIFFFISLFDEGRKQQKRVHILFTLVSIFGVMASISFGLTGVYSEDMMPMHSWFSMANFMAFGTAIALTAFLSLIGAWPPRWFSVICFAAWGFDIVFGIFGQTMWLEWVVVACLIIYVAAMSVFSFQGFGVPSKNGIFMKKSRKDVGQD